MTFIGKHLPDLVPFMEDTYTPQAVNQARNSFKKKVRKSSATFFYGAMCGFFTTDELDDLLFEASEVARFLLEVEGTTLDIDEEIDIEDRITQVMRSVGEAAKTILRTRGEETEAGKILHGGENNTPKKMPVSMEFDISTPQKTKRRKKTTDKVSSQSPPIGSATPETGDVFPMVTETSAIQGIVSAVSIPSSTSSPTHQEQEIISHLPPAPRTGTCEVEENIQHTSPVKTEREIAGDRNQ